MQSCIIPYTLNQTIIFVTIALITTIIILIMIMFPPFFSVMFGISRFAFLKFYQSLIQICLQQQH